MTNILLIYLIKLIFVIGNNKELYKDGSQPISLRVSNLLTQMTLKEKIYQLLSWDHYPPITYEFGIGRLHAGGNDPNSTIIYRNNEQNIVINNSRLNIPASFHQEALHSSTQGGTIFPMPVLQGCSWNITLIEKIASIIAYESRTVGNDLLYTPVLNLWTDARFGRLSEGFSSNPTLSAFYARAAVKGIQNDNAVGPFEYIPDNSRNALSLAKHFAAYGAALGGLNAAPSDIGKRTMFEVYLKPWKAFANVGGRGAMASHQSIDRVPMHANSYYINDVFRYNELFNFTEGQIVSDCNDVGVLQYYKIANNKSQAAARALIGGVDLDLICGNPDTSDVSGSYIELENAINSGWINESIIEKSAARVLAGKFAAGLFDNYTYVTDTNAWKDILNNSEHINVAYEAALQGITLLKANTAMFTDTYSLYDMYTSGKLKNLAILGPLAKAGATDYLGPYTNYGAGVQVLNMYEAFNEMYSNNITITYQEGVDVQSNATSGITAAVDAAKKSDAVILAIGDSTSTCGEWSDNDNLDPPGKQLLLIKEIISGLNGTNIPLIVTLIHGRPYTFDGLNNNIVLDSIDLLYSLWRPGQMGAIAIRDIIMGNKENSGRLGQSWPRNTGDVNSGSAPFLQEIRGKWVSNSRSKPDLDGRIYDTYQNEKAIYNQITDPLFEFGYGISNTGCSNKIEYNNLNIKPINNNNDYIFSVSLNVKNNCKRDVTDVIQAYLVDPPMLSMENRILVRYWKRLIGFQKIFIKSDDSMDITINIRRDDVAMYLDDTYTKFDVMSGNYTVRVGQSSRKDGLVSYILL